MVALRAVAAACGLAALSPAVKAVLVVQTGRKVERETAGNADDDMIHGEAEWAETEMQAMFLGCCMKYFFGGPFGWIWGFGDGVIASGNMDCADICGRLRPNRPQIDTWTEGHVRFSILHSAAAGPHWAAKWAPREHLQ